MVERWADWACDVVEKWPDDLAVAQTDRRTLESQAAITGERARRSRSRRS
jgi:hypothetical protein